uniref:G_PROTEIN_RECEP_F1_2 domain-containing protein n=1 Tax=Caenorhabditis tropicalis TaxID=1561998 RepID=A0A1I7TRS5_9PELO
MTNMIMTYMASVFPVACLIFNAILLAAIISTLPLAYITVMSTNGIIISLFISLHMLIYLVLSDETYAVYLVKWGRETTLGGTFSYLNYLLVSVLMTVNRVVVVIRPFNELFTHKRIFVYCGIIAILMFISLFIPYISPCFIVFNARKLAFESGCAPGRHAITVFQNTYAIILPFSCMFVNLGLIFHLKCVRNNWYKKSLLLICGSELMKQRDLNTGIYSEKPNGTEPTTGAIQSATMSKIQARRDFIMMKQTIVVAVYLSIYELGSLVVKLAPNFFMSLPQNVKDGYFYFRLESVPLMNFIIYYVETGSTRKMLRRFLNFKTDSSDSVFNATAVGPAPRTLTRTLTATHSRSRTASPIN